MVKLKEGAGKNEFIMVKCTAVEPPLVMAVVYGMQENTAKENEVRDNLTEIFTELEICILPQFSVDFDKNV